ncbi:alpha,alpha-trehalose-phosphate synthase [UDP-forming] 1-like [Magnolia sinica]|uniref:alpha,alpha-trehalose-phosphate synthase [UDP-forming] 1-like n=1 Tax=Magnolia sinica TaxID=86752 RepID=UPI0026599E20|nr:alpha,alpha-trehalose-phosphate synthase [UDP-forming] 1-like [Magnolia sinica]XP_058111510.1 alpha,alpha-trehalose-phosphate synthase [UDP-forming] 1-like [Magnolia sinica]
MEKRKTSLEHELNLREGNDWGVLHEEEVTEATIVASTLTMGWKNKDTRPLKQRILMVINRLPFFVVRNGYDSWSLETSSGGLVNALLGKREKSMLSDLEKRVQIR